jgi:cysteine-rich repeat protein
VWLRPQAVCGDGVLQGLENCDDGNAITADGCSRCRSDNCADGASSAAQLPAIGARTMVHSADLDDDGFKDVIVVELVSNTPTVSVARGSAFGLQRAVPVVLANMPDALLDPVVGGVGGSEVLDVDDDGVLDLVLFDQFNCTFQVFRGTGAGAFTAPFQSPALAVGTGVCGDGDVSANSRRTQLGAFLDVNRDGRLDAVMPASDGALRVVFQQQGGQFETIPNQLTIGVGNARCTPQQVIAADLTGIGQSSLVVSCRMVLDTEQQILIVLEQDMNGFTRHELPVDAHLTDLIAADLNGDGLDDLIGTGTKVGGQRVTRLLRNNGNFVFTTSASHDGNGDRVAVNDEGTALGLGVVGGTAFLRVAIGAGATSLTPQSSSGPVVTSYATPAFVDADGIPGSEYISAADGTVFIERQGNTCQVTP